MRVVLSVMPAPVMVTDALGADTLPLTVSTPPACTVMPPVVLALMPAVPSTVLTVIAPAVRTSNVPA